MKEQLTKLMEEYHASNLDELIDILPDLADDLEDEEAHPQQEVDLAESYKELAVLGDEDVVYPFIPYPFNN